MSLSWWKRLEIRLITFRAAYMKSKQTWSLADGYCQFEANFRTLMIEETLSASNFRFVAKMHRKSVLCSDEMSLNRPWTFDRIFVRTFDERLLEQITKFAEFRLHYLLHNTVTLIKSLIYSSTNSWIALKAKSNIKILNWSKEAKWLLCGEFDYWYINPFTLRSD